MNENQTNHHRPSRVFLLCVALLLIALGGAAAFLADLEFTTFAASLASLMLLLGWMRHAAARERAAGKPLPRLRFWSVALCLGITTVGVAISGGVRSPFAGVLFLPILIATLSFGFAAGVGIGIVVSAFFLGMGLLQGAALVSFNTTLIQVITFLLVAVATSAFAETMQRATEEARRRAEAQAARADVTQDFLDTSVMMDNQPDLENTLAIALMRLADLVPGQVCAIFLREPEGPHLQLALLTGMPGKNVLVRSLPLEETEREWRGAFDARRWSDVQQDAEGLGALQRLAPDARSVLVAPLRTWEDFFGLIYVGAAAPDGLTEAHRELVDQFARHVVFPIQRVRLQAMATTDVMTGLKNHRAFRARLADEARRAYRYGHTVSLILLDIDHFKRFNDTYGHPAGDSLLAQMGAILRGGLRSMDIAARYGGEEMAIICPETGSEDARVIAERLRALVEAYRFQLPEDGEAQLTISVGVATLPLHAPDDLLLVEQTDKALYAAKAGGRNRVCVAADNRPLMV